MPEQDSDAVILLHGLGRGAWSMALLAIQEMVFAIWMIVKGFNPAALAALSAKTATNEGVGAA